MFLFEVKHIKEEKLIHLYAVTTSRIVSAMRMSVALLALSAIIFIAIVEPGSALRCTRHVSASATH